MIKGINVDEIVRKLVLAQHDNQIMGIALVFVNEQLETEIEMSFGAGQAYALNTGIDLLKDGLLNQIKGKGQIEPKDRE